MSFHFIQLQPCRSAVELDPATYSAVKLDPATLRTHLVVALAFCSEGRRIWGSELSENSVT